MQNMLSRRGLMVLWLACPLVDAMTHANQRTMASADDAACALQKAPGNGTTISTFIMERMERIKWNRYNSAKQATQSLIGSRMKE